MKRFPVLSDEGGQSVFFNEAGGEVTLVTSFYETFINGEDVDGIAQRFLDGLYGAFGLPAPEMVRPVGSPSPVLMAPGEDWWQLVRKATALHEATFGEAPDDDAKAASWSIGAEFQ